MAASSSTGTSLAEYGRASRALELDPALHERWARSTDRAVRRALMRSPALPPGVAATVVGVRRSGMHTLGDNPVAPIDLLADNPGALRRRARLDAVLPRGLDDVRSSPDVVALGSGTVDLVLAHSCDAPTAALLAGRAEPPIDPWSLAVLLDRFGDAVVAVAPPRRLAVARALLDGRREPEAP